MHCIHTLPRSSHRFPAACDSRKTPRSWCWSVTICWKWPGNLNRLTGNWGERENVGDFKDNFGMKSVKGGGFVAKFIKIPIPDPPTWKFWHIQYCFCSFSPLGVAESGMCPSKFWQYDQPVHLGVPFLWTKSCSQKIGIFPFMGSKMGFPAHGFTYCFNVPPYGGWSQWTWWLLVVGSEIGIYLPINCGFPLWMTVPYHIYPIFDHGIHGLSPQQKSMVADGCSRSKKRLIFVGPELPDGRTCDKSMVQGCSRAQTVPIYIYLSRDSSVRMPFINLTYNVGPPSYKLVYKPQ